MNDETLPGVPRSLQKVVRVVMDRLGGRAGIARVMDGVKREARFDEYMGWADAALANSVRRELLKKDRSGLPEHMSVGGEYVALTLFTVAQYGEAMETQAERGSKFFDKVRLLEAACAEVHGEAPSAEAIIAEVLGQAK